jgi:hypothetical protein
MITTPEVDGIVGSVIALAALCFVGQRLVRRGRPAAASESPTERIPVVRTRRGTGR